MPLQFNNTFYLDNNSDVAAAVDSGAIPSARWHFDNFGAAEGRDPNANFDVSYYLEQYPDVAEAFENGVINPFDHFLRFGASENRAPSANLEPIAAGFDEEEYLAANEDVAAAVQSGVFANGYQHWVVFGRYEDSRPEATFNGGTPVSDVADTIDATELTAALNALNTAQEARADFLDGLTLDNDFNGTVDIAAGNVTAQDVTDLRDATITTVNGLTDGTVGDVSATRSDAFNQAIITEQKAINTQAVTDAQTAVNATTGLSKAITQLESAQTAFQTATTANTAAATELSGELAKANTVNATTGDDALQVVGSLAGLSAGAAVVTDSSTTSGPGGDSANPIIVVGANGQLTAADGITPSDYQGFSALLQDAQAAYSAQSTLTNATNSFETAITNVLDAEGVDVDDAGFDVSTYYNTDGDFDGTFSTDASDTSALLTAREAVSAFNEAVENYTSTKATADQLATLTTAVDDARDAIQDTEADGGLGITLLEGNANFTSASDVYLYNEDNAPTAALTGFGDGGQDRIFFGDGYNFVQIPDGSTTDNNLGNVSELDIFWQQNGADLNIFVENEAFAGNSTGDADLTSITLTGVTADEVNFANGYLSAGQMA